MRLFTKVSLVGRACHVYILVLLATAMSILSFFPAGASDPFAAEPSLDILEPTPVVDHWFGFAVASSGDEILVSSVDYTVAGQAHLFDARDGSLSMTFSAPPGVPLDSLYGYALAIDSEHVFVAAPEDTTVHPRDGTVFRFDRIAGGPPEAAYHSPSPGDSYSFGSALAVGRGYLFVGEPYAGGAGAVHVYDLASGNTTSVRTLVKTASAGGEEFGVALSVVGDVLAVGARLDSDDVPHAGAVYLFSADTGAYLGDLRVSPPADYERFGGSVAGSGTKILVGAPLYPDAGGDRPGAAYVFEGEQASPQFRQQLLRLDNPTPANMDRFGQTVAGVGDYTLVGAIWDDTCAPNSGAVYLFDQAGVLAQTFMKSASCENDWFGAALAGAGGSVLVGTTHDDLSGFSDAGAAYLFGNTPVGEQVAASVTSDDETEVTLTFDEVVVAGVTTAAAVECTAVPSHSTFELCDPPVCQDITTTATFTSTEDGGIKVCIGYGLSGCPVDPPEELGIRLYHDESGDGSLDDITVEVLGDQDIVCGVTSHLSLFEIVRSVAPRYACVGFEPPMDEGPVTVRGSRTLPLKAVLLDEDGFELTGEHLAAPPEIRVFLTPGSGGGAVDVTNASLPAGLGTEGNTFVHTGSRWQYNLKTRDFHEPGTYTVIMTSGDDAEYIVEPTCEAAFEIR